VMLKNAREMWNMGLHGAALARLCMDADNHEAMIMAGLRCPQDRQYEPKPVATSPDTK
jgi:hypothetical protein